MEGRRYDKGMGWKRRRAGTVFFATLVSKHENMTAFNRRRFLDTLGTFSATALLSSFTRPAWSRNLDKAMMQVGHRTPDQLANDEDFWYYVQQSFTVSPELINLNNGGVSPSPIIVQDAM